MRFASFSLFFRLLALSLGFLPFAGSAEPERLQQFELIKNTYPGALEENLAQVIKITTERLPQQERQARQDNVDLLNFYPLSIGPKLNNALGGMGSDWQKPALLNLGITTFSLASYLTQGRVNRLSAELKDIYHHPRPFLVSDKINLAPGFNYPIIGSNGSFPSGHTVNGYGSALLLAQIFPERTSELIAAAADFGHSRILLGAHYPLDVIGARMLVQAEVADLMRHPLYRALIKVVRLETRTRMMISCGGTVSACISRNPQSDNGYQDLPAVRARFNERMGYHFTPVGNLNYPFHTPENAGWLIFNRFPYLSDFDRKNIIATTAAPAGHPLDNQTGGPSWQRVNLSEASWGPRRLDYDLTVNMNGSFAEKMLSGWLNPYYQHDEWSNPITGTGSITKKGRGTLILSGNLALRRLQVTAGTLVLAGDSNYFTAAGQAAGGRLILNGGYNSAMPLLVGKKGILSGGGSLDAPLLMVGLWQLRGDTAFTVKQEVTILPAGRTAGENLGTTAALEAEGKAAVVHLDGTLDARRTLPGELVSVRKGATVSGNFSRILQPRQLWNSPYYYSILNHDYGVSLYLNSPAYPQLNVFSGRYLEGAVVLTRLQGNRPVRANPVFQNWLGKALNYGDMGILPAVVTGAVYADAAARQLHNIDLPTVDLGAVTGYQLLQPYLWAKITTAREKNRAHDGFYEHKIQHEKITFGVNQLITPRLFYSLSWAYADTRHSSLNAELKDKAAALNNLWQYQFRPLNTSGAYVNAGINYQQHRGKARRDLGDFAIARGNLNTVKITAFSTLGYLFKHDFGVADAGLRYGYTRLHLRSMNEHGSVLALNLPSQNFSSDFLEGRLAWSPRNRFDLGTSGFSAGARVAVVYQAGFGNRPLHLAAKIGATEFKTAAVAKDKSRILLTGGLDLHRHAHRFDLDFSYDRSHRSSQGQASLQYSYIFD